MSEDSARRLGWEEFAQVNGKTSVERIVRYDLRQVDSTDFGLSSSWARRQDQFSGLVQQLIEKALQGKDEERGGLYHLSNSATISR